jgi:hypothetical protein
MDHLTRLLAYLLLGLISSFVFRAARDALSNDPVAQERIVGSLLAALALADVSRSSRLPASPALTRISRSHSMFFFPVMMSRRVTEVSFSIAATIVGLPPDVRYNPVAWNSVIHGNITVVVFLFAVR